MHPLADNQKLYGLKHLLYLVIRVFVGDFGKMANWQDGGTTVFQHLQKRFLGP